MYPPLGFYIRSREGYPVQIQNAQIQSSNGISPLSKRLEFLKREKSKTFSLFSSGPTKFLCEGEHVILPRLKNSENEVSWSRQGRQITQSSCSCATSSSFLVVRCCPVGEKVSPASSQRRSPCSRSFPHFRK